MQRLAGRVAVVTGAADGIGRAVALAMAVEGAAVVLADHREEDLHKVQTELEKLNSKSRAIPTDITDEESVNGLVRKSLSEVGRIDILVNCASIFLPALVEDTSEEIWDKTIGVNLVGAFLCAKAVVPGMLKLRQGRIINVTSETALNGSRNNAHYAAAKAGVIGFSKALALELGRYQVTVNTICLDEGDGDSARSFLGSSLRPEESIGPAIFLASDAASYITGQTLLVSSH
jgi:3-oxoacyl-[acyl-carrier protein] reductase